MDPDDRAFMRELLLRHEKATDARIEELNALTRRIDAGTDAMIACTEIPDRLDEGGSTAGA